MVVTANTAKVTRPINSVWDIYLRNDGILYVYIGMCIFLQMRKHLTVLGHQHVQCSYIM